MLYKGVVVSKINNHYSIVYMGLANWIVYVYR